MTIVRSHLESTVRVLLATFERSATASNHGSDLGENREDLIVDLLNELQPRRLHAQRGGQVIGVTGAVSTQLDVLVTHDSTIEFRDNGKSYRLAEAVVACIGVKSNLTKAGLKEDCAGLASIPPASHSSLMVSHAHHEQLFERYATTFPVRMILGWQGATTETLLEGLAEFALERPEVPVASLPDVVAVLARGIALQIVGKRECVRGQCRRDAVTWKPVDEQGKAWWLVWLLNQLSAASGWSGLLAVSLDPYWQAASSAGSREGKGNS